MLLGERDLVIRLNPTIEEERKEMREREEKEGIKGDTAPSIFKGDRRRREPFFG